LPINVQEASRLWALKNAYITTGKRIRKRPGLKAVTRGLAGSVGLAAASGRLKVFVTVGDTFTPPAAVDKVELTYPVAGPGLQPLARIHSATMFNGYLYVVADYNPDGLYLGGLPSHSAP
jgi:hypothetical protein